MGERSEEIQLFEQCKICIICSKELSLDAAQQLASTLEEHGGDVLIYEPPSPFPSLSGFTHLMSYTIDFPGYEAACDALIPVIKPQWLHASLTKRKLANPRQYSPDPRLFLNDVVVTCGDIPEGDKDAIIGGVLAKGGIYSSRISNMVTHLVDLTTESDKARIAIARKLNMKIVLPHWFDDCLKLGKRIDEGPYTLPDPEILRAGSDAPIRYSDSKDVAGALPKALKSPNHLDVFDGKQVMLSTDLGIGSHLLESIQDLVRQGGGSLTTDVSRADMVVCRYREGFTYRMASRLNKDVGNLPWLYHLITYNTWTSPLRRLLHYPVPRNGVPGFKGLRISLSNYVGEARAYLENLIHATGAECTKTLKQDNTHLVTAHDKSEKCAAAKDWGLEVVNHLWLEESYANCKLQPVSDPRYTHFPKRTNLSEVVGQTRLNKSILGSLFFPSEDTPNDQRLSAAPSPRRMMQSKDQNATSRSAPALSKSVSMQPPAAKKDENSSSITAAAAAKDKSSSSATPRAAEKARNSAESKKLSTPARSRLTADGKENDTPSSTSSRKSKDAAAARLHDLAPDIALYEKEMKRAGGVIYGGRRKSHEEKSAANGKKRPSIEPQTISDGEDTTEIKKQKKSKAPVAMRLLITGYQKWIGNIKKEDADKRRLRDLGILVVQDASKCSHLAAPSVLRTPKFVNALAYAPVVISTEFITQCLEKDELLDPSDFPLIDKTAEEKFKFSLADAVARAKKNKNKLLQGNHICCVESIRGGFDTFKSIVEANGGECSLFRGRLSLPHKYRPDTRDDDDMEVDKPDDEVYLLSSVAPDQQKLWPRFRQMVEELGRKPRIVRVDWLLDIAMSQKLHPADEYLLNEDSMG
ncbi:hypothetical protein MPDQ_004317 [Monascus purpureus]|uniref:BRCT domain-containing protein n=1 Tax=Monascus purpureus TaxID=5098 RepID=A0A507QJF0_MONPU|nr:hypothetical protein MPDQ_004317 [Monascus purpureus]BDD58476.1 hypothetical protein MAP00_003753 [Monascus purpureus]